MTIELPQDPELRANGFSRGTNQIGVRLYNERLILSTADQDKDPEWSPDGTLILFTREEAE